MGIFDKAREAAEDYAAANPDKVDDAVRRAADEADQRTGGKYTEHIDRAEDAVADRFGGTPESAEQDPGQHT